MIPTRKSWREYVAFGGRLKEIERAIEESTDCYAVLQQTAAVRGALNGLMAELIEGHIRHHVVGDAKNGKGTEELVDIVRSYLR